MYLSRLSDEEIQNANPHELVSQIKSYAEDLDFIEYQSRFLIEANVYELLPPYR